MPDTAHASTELDVTTKFCVKIASGSTDWWGTDRDNWHKARFYIQYSNSSSWTHIADLHTQNEWWQVGKFKCTPATYSYTIYAVDQAYSGWVEVEYGGDTKFHAAQSLTGPYCFTVTRRAHDHVNPWNAPSWSTSGC